MRASPQTPREKNPIQSSRTVEPSLTWLESPQLWLGAMHTLQLAEIGYEEATLAVRTHSGKLKYSLPSPSTGETPGKRRRGPEAKGCIYQASGTQRPTRLEVSR
ncbi:hypothetical protein CYMTET_6289 [Cymbomonas tetramitiformis]|uniref:Uncharacterized protein n=1 Tax=Cymbomonas tetramitiformis TaxID=36881 RepID=A0AAE0GXJ0_9CHLO|nr:hypothetical protein CYMTET_6289 [Cymbomonas tetramitiformis]|eukprot:gene12187-biopygen12537